MLKLRRVEIQGFKSFYDRTEMKFNGQGIAAVVGPNGCGKSNLSDAISWVLGEQSAKTLRGARMEDVIFAGTGTKKALSMASVTMTLVPDEIALETTDLALANGNGHHAAGVHPTEAQRRAERSGEITITRRLYRSGESEYLINGKQVRLRDIQDLFLGTGLGPESYAIIEQGRIGQILSNKPQDRRAVIEEAAGITKFKTRKRLAEAKLESAKQNLSPVFDILEEVTRQANSLKRQAAKTKRYSELKTEASGYLLELLAAKFRLLERETAKTAIELNLVSSELTALQESVRGKEQIQSGIVDHLYATERQLTEARRQLAELQMEMERTRGRLEYQQRQIEQIDHRLRSGEEELNDLHAKKGETARELAEQSAALEQLNTECSGAREGLAETAAERQRAQAKLGEQESGLETSRQQILRLLSESASLGNRITQVEEQLGSADRDALRERAEEQQRAQDIERLKDVTQQNSERLATRQTELVSVTEQRKSVDEELQLKRLKLIETRQGLDRVRSEFSRVKARRDSLEEVIQHRSYTTENVKRLFTALERGSAPELKAAGVLADFLEVDPRYEKAMEEFLHDELEYVVVQDWASADLGIELMRNELSGRATFLVKSHDGEAEEAAELPRPDEAPGVLEKLSNVLRCTNGLANLPLSLLPRLGHAYIAADRGVAQRLATRYPHCWFLAPDGVSYHGLAVSGGKKTGAGPLALKRELREVSQLEQIKLGEMNTAQAHLAEAEREIVELTERLEHLRGQQQAHEKDVLALDHESRKLAEELQRAQAGVSSARLALERISRERVRMEESLTRDRELLAQVEQARSEQEAALAQAREGLAAVQADVARATEEHAELRASVASLEERQRSLIGSRNRLEARESEFRERLKSLAQEMERLTGERAQLISNNTELDARGAEVRAAATEVEAQVVKQAEEELGLRNRLSAAEDELKALRSQVGLAQEKRSELQVGMARSEEALRHLEETCQKELGTSLEKLEAGETVPDQEALAHLDAKFAEARRKIEALGPVNSQALEEYEEAQQRQDFLSAQRQDLLDSIRDTEKAIHEIDGESRRRFGEAFHAINANFREMFKTLFSGGIGEMRLTDEDNLSESGIDIVASPPGKKLQSVLLLSGGEKSLTAMALLMAIFEYTPSPFCILDEVDAPLDEPNIERLTKLLREMSERTQFIVITHAKRTMEAAQSLYGVTMQEPGVSKLVSVKFRADHIISERPKAAAATAREMDTVLA